MSRLCERGCGRFSSKPFETLQSADCGPDVQIFVVPKGFESPRGGFPEVILSDLPLRGVYLAVSREPRFVLVSVWSSQRPMALDEHSGNIPEGSLASTREFEILHRAKSTHDTARLESNVKPMMAMP